MYFWTGKPTARLHDPEGKKVFLWDPDVYLSIVQVMAPLNVEAVRLWVKTKTST
jgi:hypothetical protein